MKPEYEQYIIKPLPKLDEDKDNMSKYIVESLPELPKLSETGYKAPQIADPSSLGEAAATSHQALQWAEDTRIRLNALKKRVEERKKSDEDRQLELSQYVVGIEDKIRDSYKSLPDDFRKRWLEEKGYPAEFYELLGEPKLRPSVRRDLAGMSTGLEPVPLDEMLAESIATLSPDDPRRIQYALIKKIEKSIEDYWTQRQAEWDNKNLLALFADSFKSSVINLAGATLSGLGRHLGYLDPTVKDPTKPFVYISPESLAYDDDVLIYQTVERYQHKMFREGQRWLEKSESFRYPVTGIARNVMQVSGNALGYMLSGMALSKLGGPYLGTVSAGYAWFNVGYENTWRDAKKLGATDEEANWRGLVSGTIYTVMESLQASRIIKSHKVGQLNLRNMTRDISKRAWSDLIKHGKDFTSTMLVSSVSNAIEEFIEEYSDALLLTSFEGGPSYEEALERGLYGALAGGFIGAILPTATTTLTMKGDIHYGKTRTTAERQAVLDAGRELGRGKYWKKVKIEAENVLADPDASALDKKVAEGRLQDYEVFMEDVRNAGRILREYKRVTPANAMAAIEEIKQAPELIKSRNDHLDKLRDAVSQLANLGVIDEANKASNIWAYRAHEVIANKMTDNMTGQEFDKLLKNNNITKDEIKWLGLDELTKQKTVSKQLAMETIAGNSLEITEVIRVSGHDVANEYRPLVQAYHQALPGVPFDYNTVRNLINSTESQLINFAREHGLNPDTVVETFTDLDFVTLARRYVSTADEIKEGRRRTRYDKFQLPGRATNYTEITLHLPTNIGQYRSGHWPNDVNTVAHVRFNTRNVKGKKILHIEEIQSDWHTAGRKEGYISARAHEIYSKWLNNVSETRAAERRRDTEAINRLKEENNMLRRQAQEELGVSIFDLAKGVPVAPFQNDSKTPWYHLVMKRMLRYAADNDFDGVSWTTGEQQISRWHDVSAGRFISDRVDWHSLPDGKKAVTVYSAQAISALDLIVRPDGSIEKSNRNLKNMIDSDIWESISKQTEGSIEGTMFAVGGRGFISIYDQKIPSFVNKYLKNLGSSVSKINLEGVDSPVHYVNFNKQTKSNLRQPHYVFGKVLKPRILSDQEKARVKKLRRTANKANRIIAELADVEHRRDSAELLLRRLGLPTDELSLDLLELLISDAVHLGVQPIPSDAMTRSFVMKELKLIDKKMQAAKRKIKQMESKGKEMHLLNRFAPMRYAMIDLQLKTGKAFYTTWRNMVTKSLTASHDAQALIEQRLSYADIKKLTATENDLIAQWLYDPETAKDTFELLPEHAQRIATTLKDLLQGQVGKLVQENVFRLWDYTGKAPPDVKRYGDPSVILQEGRKAKSENRLSQWIAEQPPWGLRAEYYLSEAHNPDLTVDFLTQVGQNALTRKQIRAKKPSDIMSEAHTRRGSADIKRGSVINNVMYHAERAAVLNAIASDLDYFYKKLNETPITLRDIRHISDNIDNIMLRRLPLKGLTSVLTKAKAWWWRARMSIVWNPQDLLWRSTRNAVQDIALSPLAVNSRQLLAESARISKQLVAGNTLSDIDSDLVKSLNSVFKQSISQKRAYFKEFLMMDYAKIDKTLGGQVALTLQNWLDSTSGLYGFVDEMNRLGIYIPQFTLTKRSAIEYIRGDINLNEFMKRTRLDSLTSEQRRLAATLLGNGEVAKLAQLSAEWATENVNFKYRTVERSAVEQTHSGRLFAGVYVFTRGTYDLLMRNGLMPMFDGLQTGRYRMALRAFDNVISGIVSSSLAFTALTMLIGRGDYHPLAALTYTPLDPSIKDIVDILDTISRSAHEYTSGYITMNQAVDRIVNVFTQKAEYYIPLLTDIINVYEAANDVTNVTLYRAVKRKLSDTYDFKKRERNDRERLLHMLFGSYER